MLLRGLVWYTENGMAKDVSEYWLEVRGCGWLIT